MFKHLILRMTCGRTKTLQSRWWSFRDRRGRVLVHAFLTDFVENLSGRSGQPTSEKLVMEAYNFALSPGGLRLFAAVVAAEGQTGFSFSMPYGEGCFAEGH